ncbi:MAG: CRISPR-associated endonuclease Cas6 [candidate division KSB1 bacterium]|nr:CRISPR-associated endonuclease Cas6 [candidate division KSB1 bacterium]MDZ7399617.1 CRISPR-associated endonuclease Cas6 [candidate division KSB1 bacterium]
MPKLQLLTLTLGNQKFFLRDVPKLRGFFASKFPEYIELHHHIEAKKYLYSYPLVQYKVIDYKPVVIGLGEGAEILKQIYYQVNEMTIGDLAIPIHEKQILVTEAEFGLTDELKFYRFLSPWLGLNQRNYQFYQENQDAEARFELLNRVLIGNMISLAKALGYTVPGQIKVSADTRLRLIKLKGLPMSGFTGFFATNFLIPDLLGLGKSVSRGFGTVQQITLDQLVKYY